MSNLQMIIIGVLCGFILFAGLGRQLELWEDAKFKLDCGEDSNFILVPAGIAGSVFFLTAFGAIIFAIFAAIDGSIRYDGGELFFITLAVGGLCITFYIKAMIGSILISATASWSVWNLLIHGEWSFIPIFEIVFSFVSNVLPEWVGILYTILVFFYCVVLIFKNPENIKFD